MILTNKHRELMWGMVTGMTRLVVLLTSLYFFVCSLSFLSTGFRIAGGKNIGVFFESDLLSNPVVGVMLGVLVTVLVQSSSTSTSILVGLVAAGAPVSRVIPMVLGANIGTSVTNTVVAITQVGDREQFRRAFSCATVHDMFNWLSVISFMTLESFTHYLEYLTGLLVKAMEISNTNSSSNINNPDLLKAITGPLTKAVVRLNNRVLEGWASGDPEYENITTILAPGCQLTTTTNITTKPVNNTTTMTANSSSPVSCSYLLAYLGQEAVGLSDVYIGLMLASVALLLMVVCLLNMVKILNSVLGGRVTEIIKTSINSDLPYLPWLTGYVAMAVGALLTFLLQSSSVFTSTLTPLAGAGLVSLERAYPLTLGSNIGTTTTSIIASLAADPSRRAAAVQIALVHLLFNLSGILLFYMVPALRFPVQLARGLGNTTAAYPWFGGVYLLLSFLLLPGLVFLLSLAGPLPMYTAFSLLAVTGLLVGAVSLMQARWPHRLPACLATWQFLPRGLRSLEPYDPIMSRLFFCCGGGREEVVAVALEDPLEDPEAAGMVILGGKTILRSKYLPVNSINSGNSLLRPDTCVLDIVR